MTVVSQTARMQCKMQETVFYESAPYCSLPPNSERRLMIFDILLPFLLFGQGMFIFENEINHERVKLYSNAYF